MFCCIYIYKIYNTKLNTSKKFNVNILNILLGAQRPGSTRKMIGSPRQLENAAPTSKNPHGVWV